MRRVFHKRGACVLLVLALLVGAGACAQAAPDRPVRILAESFWPYSFTPDGGYAEVPRGICVEFAGEVLTAAGLPFEVSLLPWPRVMKHLREDPDQLVITMVRSAPRERFVHWIGAVATVEHALYGLHSRIGERTPTLDDARAMSVATVVDDVAHQYLRAQGFERIVSTTSYLKGLEMLLRGRVDLYPGNTALIERQCGQLQADCGDLERVLPLDELEQALYFAMSRSTDEAIVERVRIAFTDLVAAGRLEQIRARVLAER